MASCSAPTATARRMSWNGWTRIRSNDVRSPWPSTMPLGHEIRDRVVLEPFDIVEESQVTSVLVDAAVQDKNGRFPQKPARPRPSRSSRTACPQTLDLAQHETVGSTFALLIDSSASMSRRLDFVQRTAGLLAEYMSPLDRTIVAPFARSVRSITGPTDDRPTVAEAIRAIQSSGGTAILDSVIELARGFPESPGRRDGDPDHRRLRREQHVERRRGDRRAEEGAGHGLCRGHWRCRRASR